MARSEATKKMWENKEWRARVIKAHTHKLPNEWKNNISLGHKGVSHPNSGKYLKSEEHKKNLSIAHMGMKKPWAGKHNFKGGKATERIRRTFIQARRRANKLHNGGTHTLEEWKELKQTYGFRCVCCFKKEPEILLTEDHIIPISMGGTDDISNIQPLCEHCNCVKHTGTTNYLYAT